MQKYKKGANAERELIQILFSKGFSVVRTAGSGATVLPCPDILALKPDKQLAIECKAWNKSYLMIANAQMQQLKQWAKNSGTQLFIAWKINRRGWFFLQPRLFKKTKKAHTISEKKAIKKALDLNVVVGEQKQLQAKKLK